MKSTWSNKKEIAAGIFCYEDVIPQSFNIIKRLEEILSDNDQNDYFKWQDALVGYNEEVLNYRICKDFKFKKENLKNIKNKNSKKLEKIFEEIYNQKFFAVEDYRKTFNISELNFWEDFNFVKYSAGDFFKEHHDDGFSYSSTVSTVAYLNDDYEGGELYFRLQNLMIKPRAGDLYIFPSNYMYPHTAMPVKNGIKYSIVTVLDYNKEVHNAPFKVNKNLV